jgi:hypothetical protein
MKDKFYYKDGTTSSKYYDYKVLHRVDGPAREYADGDKFWHVNGKLHRNDGPALEYTDGTKLWYIDSKLHRNDGPAVEYADGGKRWYVDGKGYTEEEFNKLMKAIRKLPLALRLIDPREWVRKTVDDKDIIVSAKTI